MSFTSKAEVYEALLKILAVVEPSTELRYAQAYAQVALINRMQGEDLRVQIIYVLNNLSHWRHTDAPEVRKVLKSFIKENR